MCWVACDRLAKIARHMACRGCSEASDINLMPTSASSPGGTSQQPTEWWQTRESYWTQIAREMHANIMRNSWNNEVDSFVSSFNGTTADAYLLLLPELGFVPAGSQKFISSVSFVEKTLKKDQYLLCFPTDVLPSNSATCWFIRALARVGRTSEARRLFEHMLRTRNSSGMLSETVEPGTGTLWGNFPHSTAMVGLINCAMTLSVPWSELHTRSFATSAEMAHSVP